MVKQVRRQIRQLSVKSSKKLNNSCKRYCIPILQVKKGPGPFPFILSRAVNEAVQTALDSEHVNDQENNLIIGYLSVHMIF